MTPNQCRAARVYLNWNQRELCEKAGISLTRLCDFERERKPVSKETIRRLIQAFGKAGLVLLFGGVVLASKAPPDMVIRMLERDSIPVQ
jgi:transcriptional regulator with XRE-family HTH domain